MKRTCLTVLAALVVVSATHAAGSDAALAEDAFGKRLLSIANTDCYSISVPKTIPDTDKCRDRKAMALSAYGQWRIMQMLCTGPMKKWRCEEAITEFETTVKRSLIGD